MISEIDGISNFWQGCQRKRKVVVTPEIGEEKEYLIPKGKHISVQDGDRVIPGDPLMDGVNNSYDLLAIKGEKNWPGICSTVRSLSLAGC